MSPQLGFREHLRWHENSEELKRGCCIPWCRGLVLVLLLCVLCLQLQGCSLTPNIRENLAFREILLQGEGSDKLLLIDISGFISNAPLLIPEVGVIPGMVARLRQELELAYRDPALRGILLRINSPGGTLTDSDLIYHLLTAFKRSKNVKIIAALGDVAASGGLYVAMAADEIYAQPTTITGSVGVIIPHLEYAGLMEKLGVRSDPVSSGALKDAQSPYKTRSKAERELIEDLVQEQHKRFLEVIEHGRPGISRRQLDFIADGRILSARGAKHNNLVDGIQYLDQTYRRLGELSGVPKNRLVRYANVWATGSNIYSNTFPIEVVP